MRYQITINQQLRTIQQFKEEHIDNALYQAVVNDILDRPVEEVEEYLLDVVNNGCQSGIVTSLIYYEQTKAFFATYFDEIFELIQYEEEESDCKVDVDYSYNSFSWWAYEYLCNQICQLL